jgi:hypothetical protein
VLVHLRPGHLRQEEVARPPGGGRAPAGKEVVSPSSPFFRSRAGRGGVAPKTGEARCRCLPSLQCCVIAVDRYPGDPNSERMSAGWGVEEVERERAVGGKGAPPAAGPSLLAPSPAAGDAEA